MKVLTKDLIVKSEENAVKSGAFSFTDLMLTAGNSVAKIIDEKFYVKDKKVAVICGNGNNAGDGYVAAKRLYELGADVTVVNVLGEPKTENALYYYNLLKPIRIINYFPFQEKFDIYVDAIFGIGLNKSPDDNIKSIINHCNNSSATNVSIDIPSGVECDTGRVLSCAFMADLTVTFIALKPCFMLPLGSDYCGEVIVSDIGVKPCDYSFLTNEKPNLKKRTHNSHKGTFGTALLICGSYGMAGAAILSAKAALKTGVGIVKCILCKGIYSPFTCSIPEAVCIPFRQNNKGTLKYSKKLLNNSLVSCNAVLIGCGMGKSRDAKKILKYIILNSKTPIVIDADGINNLCTNIELLRKSKAPIIITPHPAEMGRLINLSAEKVEQNRLQIAKDFAKQYNCIVVLKGANTIIALPNGEIIVNINGNAGMATAGSGDVLAGIIVSLLAQGYTSEFSAKSAVYIHSQSGDTAALIKGENALIASDIIDML